MMLFVSISQLEHCVLSTFFDSTIGRTPSAVAEVSFFCFASPLKVLLYLIPVANFAILGRQMLLLRRNISNTSEKHLEQAAEGIGIDLLTGLVEAAGIHLISSK